MSTVNKAFILAAGFGKRLRPHTDTVPKPMVEVAGRTLIDRTIDHLIQSGIRDVTVNTHYLANVLEDHLINRTDAHLHLSHEPEILETGGGIKNALTHFNDEDFFVLSGDGLWENGANGKTLDLMKRAWNPKAMDIFILLQPVSSMKATQGVGDYNLLPDGRAKRAKDKSGAYMFTSMRINRAGIFDGTPAAGTPFSYLELLDKAEAEGRLYGMIHEGDWHHISTPEDLESVRALYAANAAKKSAV